LTESEMHMVPVPGESAIRKCDPTNAKRIQTYRNSASPSASLSLPLDTRFDLCVMRACVCVLAIARSPSRVSLCPV